MYHAIKQASQLALAFPSISVSRMIRPTSIRTRALGPILPCRARGLSDALRRGPSMGLFSCPIRRSLLIHELRLHFCVWENVWSRAARSADTSIAPINPPAFSISPSAVFIPHLYGYLIGRRRSQFASIEFGNPTRDRLDGDLIHRGTLSSSSAASFTQITFHHSHTARSLDRYEANPTGRHS